jgi:hypothetical protein
MVDEKKKKLQGKSNAQVLSFFQGRRVGVERGEFVVPARFEATSKARLASVGLF